MDKKVKTILSKPNALYKIVALLIMLPLTHVYAQQVSFQTFLSEFEKSKSIDSIPFGKVYDFIDYGKQYSQFLPPTNEECRCEQENISWKKGSYVEYKNFIAAMLQRVCYNYQDGNSQWFMENDVTDYMLITYSRKGEILDYKIVGHSGRAYVINNITAAENDSGIIVEQKILDDCSLLRQYKNLVYTVSKHKYILKSDGKIEEQSVGVPNKETLDVLSSIKQFSFEQFMSYFKKWDKTNVDHTLFSLSSDDAELPFESCLSLLPDTLDYNCWPRDIQWEPCQYIENEKGFYCFIIKDCMTPKAGFSPYTDYLILEFNKNGTFKSAKNIYHSDDNSVVDNATRQSLITKALKAFYTEKTIN